MNNKGADQTVRMHSLNRAFDVCMMKQNQIFSQQDPYDIQEDSYKTIDQHCIPAQTSLGLLSVYIKVPALVLSSCVNSLCTSFFIYMINTLFIYMEIHSGLSFVTRLYKF